MRLSRKMTPFTPVLYMNKIRSMMRTVIDSLIFLVEAPFVDRDYKRFGIERLMARGFGVLVWDLSEAVHPSVIHQVEGFDRKQWEGYRSFSTKDEVVQAIKRLPRTTMVICLLGYYRKTYFVYRALSSRHIPYAVMVVSILPRPISTERKSLAGRFTFLFAKIKDTPFAAGFFHVMDRLLLRAYPFFGIQPASLCILGGSQSTGAIDYPVGRATRYVWTHTLDYDLYLSLKDRPVQEDAMMGVFLDEYLPFHPDLIYTGNQSPCPSEEYYPQLRSFFGRLEAEHDVHITVAAHPRSQYEHHPDYFSGRPVIRGDTPALVQRAGFVILHASTALNFAILFEKPVIFVSNRGIDANPGTCRLGTILATMATLLGKKPIQLDEPYTIDWNCELTIDRGAYAKYLDGYIKRKGTEERNTWDIVADAIASGSMG
jgi:hypothetical protein